MEGDPGGFCLRSPVFLGIGGGSQNYVCQCLYGTVSLSGAFDHLAHYLCHAGLCGVGSLLYLFVADFDRYVEFAEIGDDTDTEHLDAAVPGYDDFRHGTHPDSIRSHLVIHTVFGRGLEGRALYAHVDAVHHPDVLFLCNFIGQCHQFMIVCLVHVRESGACREVVSSQRMFREHIDMVGDDHQVADSELRIHAP